jgi:excisionase family DNA binding protein
MLQVSRPSVAALIDSGRLVAIKVGRHWRISAASLDDLGRRSPGTDR